MILNSCSEGDDPVNNEIAPTLVVENFSKSVLEKCEEHNIGKIIAESNQGDILYTIISQNPEGALLIDSETGMLTTDDITLFDSDSSGISAEIEVSSGELSKIAHVNIEVLEGVGFDRSFRYDHECYPLGDIQEKSAFNPYSTFKSRTQIHLSSPGLIVGDFDGATGIGDRLVIHFWEIAKPLDELDIDEEFIIEDDFNGLDSQLFLGIDSDDYYIEEEIIDGKLKLKRVRSSTPIDYNYKWRYHYDIEYDFTLSNGKVIKGRYDGLGFYKSI